MKRETGLRRTAMLTGALVVAGVTGTAAVGVAAYAADHAAVVSTTTSTSSPTSSPQLSSGGSGGSVATSGGS